MEIRCERERKNEIMRNLKLMPPSEAEQGIDSFWRNVPPVLRGLIARQASFDGHYGKDGEGTAFPRSSSRVTSSHVCSATAFSYLCRQRPSAPSVASSRCLVGSRSIFLRFPWVPGSPSIHVVIARSAASRVALCTSLPLVHTCASRLSALLRTCRSREGKAALPLLCSRRVHTELPQPFITPGRIKTP